MSRDALARWLAALVGAPVAAALVSAAVTALPGPREAVFAVGFHLLVPLWLALACGLPLARSGRVAWALVAALAAPAALLLLARAGAG